VNRIRGLKDTKPKAMDIKISANPQVPWAGGVLDVFVKKNR
jgi:hypothetical protein